MDWTFSRHKEERYAGKLLENPKAKRFWNLGEWCKIVINWILKECRENKLKIVFWYQLCRTSVCVKESVKANRVNSIKKRVDEQP